jgi:hypothetical protein
MLEIAYQFSLWRLQHSKRRELGKLKAYRLELEKREAAGEVLPMTGSRDAIDAVGIQIMMLTEMYDSQIGALMTGQLVDRAQWYIVPVPDRQNTEFWELDRSKMQHLSAAGITKLRSEIRAEKKARWESWQSRLTLALALIGSIFGVLAYFTK